MQERLCTECVFQNRCWFVARVNQTIDALLPSEKQMPVTPRLNITEEASIVNEQIAKDRITARYYGCPQVNYNPQNRNFQPNL